MLMNATGATLVCLGPSSGFEVRPILPRKPAPGEIEVAVAAASVNPIDVRRAHGYGRQLLSLVGAGRFPMVLGNDFAGTVTALGDNVDEFKIGDPVYGAKPPSVEGTHASYVLVKAAHALPARPGQDLQALAALPYSFVTMWLAVRGAGLTRQNAAEKRVLVHGAAGGLGTLALQMLSAWGASVTAIARPSDFAACRQAGALEVVDSSSKPFAMLSRTFDATLNFAAWDDDLALIGALRDGALGHATSVHPLLANFDELGWVRGFLKTLSDKRRHRAALPKNGRYVWTIFKPETPALQELRELVEQRRVGLPIAVREPLAGAAQALEHVKKGRRGRALILPS
jgi:NADPH:quinone reductase-like Zn-dependent oxidoreductase